MRPRPCIAIGLAILCSACKPAAIVNRVKGDSAGTGEKQPVATIALAASATGDCQARWNGEAVTQAAVVQRGISVLEQAIREAGGIEAITEESLPFVRIEAAPAMAYACIGATLRSLQSTGFPGAQLRPAGGRNARVEFFIENVPASILAATTIEVGRGALSWNGTATNLSGLRAYVQAMAAGEDSVPPQPDRTPPPVVALAPPGQIVVRVARDAPFGELQAVLATLADGQQTATLMSCAGPSGPPGDSQTPC